MNGNAEHHVAAYLLAHLACRHILLADVNAVGVALYRNVNVVVYEKRHGVFSAQRADLDSFGEKLIVVKLLFAKLHTGSAALERGFYLLVKALLSDPCSVRHCVQEHVFFIALHILHLPQAARE